MESTFFIAAFALGGILVAIALVGILARPVQQPSEAITDQLWKNQLALERRLRAELERALAEVLYYRRDTDTHSFTKLDVGRQTEWRHLAHTWVADRFGEEATT